MPRSTRPQRERTHDWQKIRQYTLWPEQTAYESLRTVVLASLFPKEPASPTDTSHSLPPDMRQLMVDLKAEHPTFRPHEIATICYVRFGRKPSHHSVQHVLASGPKPSITKRRFPLYAEMASGSERRLAVVRLHAEGWSVSTISAYLQVNRTTVYDSLKRWAREGFEGLKDKSHVPHEPARKVTFEDIQEVRRLARNPDLGAFRVMAALEQVGIKLSRATCGRLLALNRNLYGMEKPKRGPDIRKEMPFKATFRQQFWSVGAIRLTETSVTHHECT